MIKNCGTCDYGSRDELGDIVCVNGSSVNCAEFINDSDTCEHWQNYQNEFWGDE